jgi:uncharacterized membrane protein YqgA involved in biofilm formation
MQGLHTLSAGLLEELARRAMNEATAATEAMLIPSLGLVLLELRDVLPVLLIAPLLVAAALSWPF